MSLLRFSLGTWTVLWGTLSVVSCSAVGESTERDTSGIEGGFANGSAVGAGGFSSGGSGAGTAAGGFATGGTLAAGGVATGGSFGVGSSGGSITSGGTTNTGGSGGTTSAGGSTNTGGTINTGGTTNTGGTANTGGSGGTSTGGTSGGCGENQDLCGGSCVDLLYNNAHCGECDNACPVQGWCEVDTCRCWDGAIDCNGVCKTPQDCDGSSGGTGGTSGGSGGTSGSGGSTGSGGNGGSGGGANLPDITDGCQGWASRYWDCCKPHCAWSGNVSTGSPVNSCGAENQSIDPNATSACDGGNSYMCQGLAPWTSNDVAYGYAAIANTGDICGRCYHLQFTGSSHNAGSDPGSAALAGKHMIVQAINIGGVQGNQFDLLIPGGGVGDFNACSTQWEKSDIGERFGGFLQTCRNQGNQSHEDLKSCVAGYCSSVLGTLPDLYAGCMWFVDWYEVADNPTVVYEPIECPAEIANASGLNGQSHDSCLGQ